MSPVCIGGSVLGAALTDQLQPALCRHLALIMLTIAAGVIMLVRNVTSMLAEHPSLLHCMLCYLIVAHEQSQQWQFRSGGDGT